MAAVCHVGARQGGDRHRAFALPVDLNEHRTEGLDRLEDIRKIHRPACVNHAAQPRAGRAGGAGMGGQAFDHGRRGEHVQSVVMLRQIEDFARLEPARGRADMARAAQHMDHRVEPRAVAHRGGVERGVLGSDLVHIGQIAERHGDQHAVRDAHALGPSGGAGGVEEPGQIVGRAGGEACHDRAARHGLRRDALRGKRRLPCAVGEGQARGGILDDPGGLGTVQLGIDRYGGGPSIPYAVERQQILGRIAHEERDPVARLYALLHKRARDLAGGVIETRVVHDLIAAQKERGAVGHGLCRAFQPDTDIHWWSSRRAEKHLQTPRTIPYIYAKRLARRGRRGIRSGMDIGHLAFDHAPVGLALLEHRIIRACNLQFAAIFGDTPPDYTDIPLARYYPSIEDYRRIGADALAVMRKTGRYSDERVMKRRDGTLFWCRVRGQSLTPEAPFQRGIWSFSDLSEERPLVALTQREREVAILTCRGLTSKEIGLELGLSYRTVEVYRARLLEKFHARKLAELVAKLSGMPL